ncbi:class I SAM-dependent methyltransferase [bacterium]|nr:class I SAM-dependent methyltransferase [bacterium]
MYKCIKCSRDIEDGFKCSCGFEPEFSENGILLFDKKDAYQNKYFHDSQMHLFTKYEDVNFWLVSRKNLIVNLINKYTKGNFKKYIEIGSGSGYIANAVKNKFKNSKIMVADIYLSMLNLCNRYIDKENLIQMNATNIPFSDEFDVIGMFDVLEHIDEDKVVLSQIYSALHDGGRFFVIVPQHKILWSKSDEYTGHVRRYSRKELIEKMENAGFKIEFTSSFMCFLFPLMFLSRFLKKFMPKNSDISDEIKINPFLNKIFGFLLNIETKLIEKGMDMPFGGSICAIGRKK